MKNKQFLENFLSIFAVLASCFWASLLIVTTLLFIFKAPIGILNLVLSLIFTLFFSFWYANKTTGKNFIVVFSTSLVLFLISFLMSILVSGYIFDTSYDGQAYHQEAVIQLSRGWNPVYMMLENEATANLERWLNHYPKGVWILAASIYKITGNIEQGKALSLFVPFLTFIFSLWAFWKLRFNIFLKVLVSLCLALNPVSITQSLSYYADGVLVSMLLNLGLVCFKYVQTKQKYLFWPFIFVFIITVNIKLSSVVFAGILVMVFIFYLWFKDKLKSSLKLFRYLLVGLILGVGFVGFNPYVTNFSLKGHPLYPAMGKGAYDYVPSNTPQNYWSLPSPGRMLFSIFSISSNARGEGKFAQFKIPFTFSLKELESFRETNTKTGGFGPLYGGIFIVSLVLLGFYLLLFDVPKVLKARLSLIWLIILGSGGAVATSSVARYVPFLWWLPIILILFLIVSKKVYIEILATIYLFLLLINIGLVVYSYFPYSISQSQKLDNQLKILRETSQNEPLLVEVGQFGSTKLKLKEYGITFEEIPSGTQCKFKKTFLVSNISFLCQEPFIESP